MKSILGWQYTKEGFLKSVTPIYDLIKIIERKVMIKFLHLVTTNFILISILLVEAQIYHFESTLTLWLLKCFIIWWMIQVTWSECRLSFLRTDCREFTWLTWYRTRIFLYRQLFFISSNLTHCIIILLLDL